MRLRKIVFNDDSYQRLKDLTARYQNATTPLIDEHRCRMGIGDGRKNTTVSLCYHSALPLTESHLVYQVGESK
jgi:hypothetical protein